MSVSFEFNKSQKVMSCGSFGTTFKAQYRFTFKCKTHTFIDYCLSDRNLVLICEQSLHDYLLSLIQLSLFWERINGSIFTNRDKIGSKQFLKKNMLEWFRNKRNRNKSVTVLCLIYGLNYTFVIYFSVYENYDSL